MEADSLLPEATASVGLLEEPALVSTGGYFWAHLLGGED